VPDVEKYEILLGSGQAGKYVVLDDGSVGSRPVMVERKSLRDKHERLLPCLFFANTYLKQSDEGTHTLKIPQSIRELTSGSWTAG
jgi:hypothetical protein